jgi:hypothetical protein
MRCRLSGLIETIENSCCALFHSSEKSQIRLMREHLSGRLTRKTRLKSHFRGWKNATVRTSTFTSVAHPLPQQRPELYGLHCGKWM